MESDLQKRYNGFGMTKEIRYNEAKSRLKRSKCQKVVIVLGSPRSGTSLTAGLLTILGVDMGKVRPPDFENPTGYYEDVDFSRLIAEIFKAADPQANGFNLPSRSLLVKQYQNFASKVQSLIANRTATTKADVWGWKVTSTIFLIDLFLPYLVNPHFVVVLRNPLDIAKSMVKYTERKGYRKISILDALMITNRYYDSIFSFLKCNPGLPWTAISYEDLLINPQQQARRLAAFLGLKISVSQLDEVKGLVNPPIERQKMIWRVKARFSRLIAYVVKGIRHPKRAAYFACTIVQTHVRSRRKD